jgi:hypothetical protein
MFNKQNVPSISPNILLIKSSAFYIGFGSRLCHCPLHSSFFINQVQFSSLVYSPFSLLSQVITLSTTRRIQIDSLCQLLLSFLQLGLNEKHLLPLFQTALKNINQQTKELIQLYGLNFNQQYSQNSQTFSRQQ